MNVCTKLGRILEVSAFENSLPTFRITAYTRTPWLQQDSSPYYSKTFVPGPRSHRDSNGSYNQAAMVHGSKPSLITSSRT